MKRLGLLLLAITLMLAGNAFAQNVGDNSVYFVAYYSNANTAGAPDAVVRIVNDGSGYANIDPVGVAGGILNAAIYVFDDSQELRSCCACQITADGLLSESVNQELTSDTFTIHGEFSRGAIKVISSSSGDPTNPVPSPGLRGWATHIEATTTTFPAPGAGNRVNAKEAGPWFVDETALADSNLSAIELSNLGTVCGYGLTLASGYGRCPCTPEDYDF
ncbi:MAG TPA: hypothetical protein VK302_01785 [Terriglobales bacterium]|nr:hypothetical protein [Terriglobales bacterium]